MSAVGWQAPRIVRCHAEGKNGDWHAICMDLDIAVQGSSFEEVFHSLNDAISLYLETVADLPAEDRERLLHRPAPWPVRLKFLRYALRSTFREPRDGGHHHQFTRPLAA